MKSLILAAGYATRLYPLTENFPKPLLPVGGKPILNWLLDDIDTIPDITEHVIVTNHKFIEDFNEWEKTLNLTKPMTILDDGTTKNENRLGAVNDIWFAVNELKIDEDLLVLAGDNLLTFSLEGFVKFEKVKQASCIIYHEENDLTKQQRTGIITLDETDKVTTFEEKPQIPKSNLAVPPFYCYRMEDVKRIPLAIAAGCSADAPGSFAAWLSGVTDVYAWKMPGIRYDIGNLDTYEKVKKNWRT